MNKEVMYNTEKMLLEDYSEYMLGQLAHLKWLAEKTDTDADALNVLLQLKAESDELFKEYINLQASITEKMTDSGSYVHTAGLKRYELKLSESKRKLKVNDPGMSGRRVYIIGLPSSKLVNELYDELKRKNAECTVLPPGMEEEK